MIEGREYVITIAGNDPLLTLLLDVTQDEYYGLPYLGTLFPVTDVNENRAAY